MQWWWVAGFATALVMVLLGVAYVSAQWGMWSTVAEQSPRLWVRRGLRRRWSRVLVITMLGALGAG